MGACNDLVRVACIN